MLQVFLKHQLLLNPIYGQHLLPYLSSVNVIITNDQNDLPIDEQKIVKIVESFCQLENIHADEVSITFVSTQMICQMHADYFDDPTTTDCISFPMDDEGEEYRVLGEIYVCPQTAIDYCREHGGAPFGETVLYVIHGLLHLIGLDDLEDQDIKEMRKREQAHLENLKSLIL